MQLFVFGDCPHVIFGPVIFYAGGGFLNVVACCISVLLLLGCFGLLPGCVAMQLL